MKPCEESFSKPLSSEKYWSALTQRSSSEGSLNLMQSFITSNISWTVQKKTFLIAALRLFCFIIFQQLTHIIKTKHTHITFSMTPKFKNKPNFTESLTYQT